MESLSDTTWDVLICGTGLRQSLLALALSQSGKKILHIDQNNFYGGTEAAFSLQDASTWINEAHSTSHPASTIEPVSSWPNSHSHLLGASRSYTLTLSPHLTYSQSALLPALVSSRLHTQLDFQAVGPWWIDKGGSPVESTTGNPEKNTTDAHFAPDSHTKGTLQKIPSTREDVFADDTFSPRDKRSLMKFLRSVLAEPVGEAEQNQDASLSTTLSGRFRVAASIHQPLLALSLSYDSANAVKTSSAVPRIRRHMQSIGAFGPGFGAVMAKYGGGAEIAQVACRASAVGGAVYVLGRGLKKIRTPSERRVEEQVSTSSDVVQSDLSDGEEIKARFIVGCAEDFPEEVLAGPSFDPNDDLIKMAHSISIVSSPLEHLFPATSEGGPVPAGAVVVKTGKDSETVSLPSGVSEEGPTYMVVHSADSGECPTGQCIIYASTSCHPPPSDDHAIQRLNHAVSRLLTTSPVSDPRPELLWSLTYHSRGRPLHVPAGPVRSTMAGRVMVFPPPSVDLAFDDSILDSVKEMWQRIMGEEVVRGDFLRFDDRVEGREDGDGEGNEA